MFACLCSSLRSGGTQSERLVSKTKTLTGRSGDAVPSLHNTCNKHTKPYFRVSKSERTHQSPVCVCVCVLSVNHRLSASFLPLYLFWTCLSFLKQLIFSSLYHHSRDSASQNTFKTFPWKKKKKEIEQHTNYKHIFEVLCSSQKQNARQDIFFSPPRWSAVNSNFVSSHHYQSEAQTKSRRSCRMQLSNWFTSGQSACFDWICFVVQKHVSLLKKNPPVFLPQTPDTWCFHSLLSHPDKPHHVLTVQSACFLIPLHN